MNTFHRPMHATDPTWNSFHSSPDLRGESQATDRLSHGTTFIQLVRAVLTFSLCVREPTLSERFVGAIRGSVVDVVLVELLSCEQNS